MATEKQIAANRSNALSSTGPRSLAGKARSSQRDTASKLTRYETSLRRHLDMTLKQLREMRRPRREREEAAEKERAKEKARSRLVDPEGDPAYWAGIDRQRIKRMDPP
jgi:hypothetical protein